MRSDTGRKGAGGSGCFLGVGDTAGGGKWEQLMWRELGGKKLGGEDSVAQPHPCCILIRCRADNLNAFCLHSKGVQGSCGH